MRPPGEHERALGAPSRNPGPIEVIDRGRHPFPQQQQSNATITRPAQVSRGQQTAVRFSRANAPDMYNFMAPRRPNTPLGTAEDDDDVSDQEGQSIATRRRVTSNTREPSRTRQQRQGPFAVGQQSSQTQRGRVPERTPLDVADDPLIERVYERYPELIGISLDTSEVRVLMARIRCTEVYMALWVSSLHSNRP